MIQGVYSWLDGRQYEGEWIKNNMEGVGIYSWSDGRLYEGEYLNDKKQGYGKYLWADGRSYEGYWYKGKQYGLGQYKSSGEDSIKSISLMANNNGMRCGLWEDG